MTKEGPIRPVGTTLIDEPPKLDSLLLWAEKRTGRIFLAFGSLENEHGLDLIGQLSTPDNRIRRYTLKNKKAVSYSKPITYGFFDKGK